MCPLKSRGPLPVQAIDLSQVPADLEEPMEMTIPLVVSIPDVGITVDEQPEAVVRINPALETKVVGLPVRVLGNADVLERCEIESSPGGGPYHQWPRKPLEGDPTDLCRRG